MTDEMANGGSVWRAISPDRFSDIVGAIYDCALRPELWPQTILLIAEAANCFAGMIGMIDLVGGVWTVPYSAGYPDGCVDWMTSNAPDLIGLYRTIPDIPALYDEPISGRRTVPPEVIETSPYIRELTTKHGISDSINIFLIAEPTRVAEFALSRHESRGVATDDDLALLRLLAPHIRRSVTISDLLDMKSIEGQALGSTLDSFAVGVVIVGSEGRILHSNDAARRMLAKGAPITSNGGRLAALQSRTSDELQQAIAIARTNEAGIGKIGIGVPLIDHNMNVATAHVLPLARGARRGRLMAEAIAAVFIMPADAPQPMDLGLVARMFSLTPAETRVLSRLAAGDGVAEAAIVLGISEATAKTHRTHVFAKMNVKRRADLLALLAQLLPPLQQSAR